MRAVRSEIRLHSTRNTLDTAANRGGPVECHFERLAFNHIHYDAPGQPDCAAEQQSCQELSGLPDSSVSFVAEIVYRAASCTCGRPLRFRFAQPWLHP